MFVAFDKWGWDHRGFTVFHLHCVVGACHIVVHSSKVGTNQAQHRRLSHFQFQLHFGSLELGMLPMLAVEDNIILSCLNLLTTKIIACI